MTSKQPAQYRVLVDGLRYPDPADEPSVRAAGGLTAFAAQVSAEVFAAVHGRLRRRTRGEVVDDLPAASLPDLLAQGWVGVVDEDFGGGTSVVLHGRERVVTEAADLGAVRKPARPRKARRTRRTPRRQED